MNGKIIKYSRNHSHVYTFDADSNEWKLIACRLSGDMDRCTASNNPLPAGTKFDGTTKLTELEELNASI